MDETNSNCVRRQEIKAAVARAAELRAIHTALTQGGSPNHSSIFSSSSPPANLPAHDYPIFTPSYEDEPLSGYNQLQLENRALSEAWEDGVGNSYSGCITENGSSMKNSVPGLSNHAADHDTRSVTSSFTNQIILFQTGVKSSLSDVKSVSSCNKCSTKNGVNDADSIASSTTHCKQSTQPKNKGMIFSWLLPRSKKKTKGETKEESRIQNGLGALSVETLKKELLEANRKRDVALDEVAGMKSSFGELKKKLENLEGYCEELKIALRQAVEQPPDKLIGNVSKRGKLVPEDLMPASEKVMVESFLQIVSEARLSVKHFCKMLIKQVDETDVQLIDNLNSLLLPYNLSLSSTKCSKAVLYHLEAIINQILYEDFENSIFKRNGTPKLLDPHQDRQGKFSSFVALRNLSWNEVIRKGTKYYSEELSGFCDQKMSFIVSGLSWIRPWPEQLLQSFFVAAKCIWLVHSIAFSFYPHLNILRVEENRQFDPHYMEDIPMDRKRPQQGTSRVKIMVMPGFYVQDKILKCKVLCRYKSVA
ncbi:hypothetical protein V2J09_022660 [Rumex salicifolius]